MKILKLIILTAAFALGINANATSGNTLHGNKIVLEKGSTSSEFLVYLNNSVPISNLQFDLVLPADVEVAYTTSRGGAKSYNTTVVIPKTEDTDRFDDASDHTVSLQEQPDKSMRFVLASATNYEIYDEDVEGNDIKDVSPILKIKLKVPANMNVGAYDVVIKNIILNNYNSETGVVTPFEPSNDASSFFVKPTTGVEFALNNGVLSIVSASGDNVDAANYASIVGTQSCDVVDLRAAELATDLKASDIQSASASLYYLPSGSKISGNNIVIDNECSNYVIEDGKNVVILETFTATNASYSRTMSNQWGTIVLPYEVASDENVEYYAPSSVDGGALKLTKLDVLPANTPALVAKVSGEGISANASNVTVSSDLNSSVNGNVTMFGSYINDTKVTDANAYYIKDNKFWLNNQYFYIDAFRAYFIVDGAANAKVLSIGEATAIDALTGDGSAISGYYDAAGRAQNGLKKGVNIVRMSNGVTQKIIVE